MRCKSKPACSQMSQEPTNLSLCLRLFHRYRDLAPQLVPLDYSDKPAVTLPYELIGSMPELKVPTHDSSDSLQVHLPFLNNSSTTNCWEAATEINLGYQSKKSFWKLLAIPRKHAETAQRLNRVWLCLLLTQH